MNHRCHFYLYVVWFTKIESKYAIYIKGEFIGGCDIVKEMYENGELKKALEDKEINYKK